MTRTRKEKKDGKKKGKEERRRAAFSTHKSALFELNRSGPQCISNISPTTSTLQRHLRGKKQFAVTFED